MTAPLSETLKCEIKILIFDQYGTIVDMQKGIERSNILFVANHAFDCIGAKAWGFRTLFIDRRKRPFGKSPHQPDLIVKDFNELADFLAHA